jgi:O-antigen/teichoic acid export membrane protein
VHEKELLKGGGTTFIYRLATMGLNYVILFVISYYFGASGVGEYNLLTSLLSILTMLGCLGFSTSVVRFVSQYQVQEKQNVIVRLYHAVLKYCTITSLILSTTTIVFAKHIAFAWYHDQNLAPSIILLAIALPFSVLTSIQVEFIRGFKKIKVSEFFRNLSILIINTVLIIIIQWFYYEQELPFITYCMAIFHHVYCHFVLLTSRHSKNKTQAGSRKTVRIIG